MTKITGLNTMASRLFKLNILSIPESHPLESNTFIKIRNGDPMINIHRRPTLMILARKRKRSQTVKKNSKRNLKANQNVSFIPVLLSTLR